MQSREYRVYCEALYVLQIKNKTKRREYLELVEKARGISAKEELQREIMRWFHVQKQSVSKGGG